MGISLGNSSVSNQKPKEDSPKNNAIK